MKEGYSFPTQSDTIKLRQHTSIPALQIPWQKKLGNVLVRELYGDMIKHQVIDLLLKCLCQVYCGVCNVLHDCSTLSRSTLVTLQYIHGSWWPSGLGVCLAHRRLWVRFPCKHIPWFFLLGYLLCRSWFMLSEFNCNTMGWKTVPFFHIQYIQLAFVSSNWSSVCLHVVVQDAWSHFLLNHRSRVYCYLEFKLCYIFQKPLIVYNWSKK